jgi:hypothetical protein
MAKARFDAMAESRKATFAEWSNLSQQYSASTEREHGTIGTAEWRVHTKSVELNECWMQALTGREQAARIEQRRRQWDLEASQSIKE